VELLAGLGILKNSAFTDGVYGALTDQVGKIALFDNQSYVAVERSVAHQALLRLQAGKIKGRSL
jgi:ATP-independent RNA helicase DbpA